MRYPTISPDAGLFPSDMNEGYWWALALFGASLIGTLTRSHSNFISNQSLLRTRTTLTALLFQKALRVPGQSRNEGDVMSLMSTDTIRPFELTYCIHMVWTSPIMIAVGVWLLWRQVGAASLAGLATLVYPLPTRHVNHHYSYTVCLSARIDPCITSRRLGRGQICRRASTGIEGDRSSCEPCE